MGHPMKIVILSGKRKSGKDYIAQQILDRIGNNICSILRLSAPLKSQYAKENNLDFNKLLDASVYKEKYRADMIEWGEEKRNREPGYFCELVINSPDAEKPVWIISDARRKTDLEYFWSKYPGQVLAIRVEADEVTRQDRGWGFTPGVDDAESECGLDNVLSWDWIITNNGNKDELEDTITNIVGTITESCSQ